MNAHTRLLISNYGISLQLSPYEVSPEPKVSLNEKSSQETYVVLLDVLYVRKSCGHVQKKIHISITKTFDGRKIGDCYTIPVTFYKLKQNQNVCLCLRD